MAYLDRINHNSMVFSDRAPCLIHRKSSRTAVIPLRIAIIPIAVLLIIAFALSAAAETVYVKWVIDGDTIVLNNNRRIRYIGIDCPETAYKDRKGEPFGEAAKKFNANLVFHKRVRLEYDRERSDRYKRGLAYIFLMDGTFVNKELILEGLAVCLPKAPNRKYKQALLKAQRAAMQENKGLWKTVPRNSAPRIGNLNSEKFHLKSCPSAKRISKRNRTMFNNSREAYRRGFAPCRRCRPK